MKKIFFILSVALCIFALNNSIVAQKSKSFKNIIKTFQVEKKRFLQDVFALNKTGAEMDSTMRRAMEESIFNAFLTDYSLWGKYIIKYDGEKSFSLKLKRIKGFENEASEYLAQFKKIQQDFVKERLIWNQDALSKAMAKERLKPYITAVMKKFEANLKTIFEKIKS